MAIENGLYGLLTSTDTVTANLGDRTSVFFNFVPRGAKIPCVVIHAVTSVPIVTLDATADLAPKRFQFDCYAADYFKSHQLSKSVFDLLKDFSGVLGDGTVVQACVVNNDFDMPFELGAKDITFRAILDITIWYVNQ